MESGLGVRCAADGVWCAGANRVDPPRRTRLAVADTAGLARGEGDSGGFCGSVAGGRSYRYVWQL